MHKTTSTDIFLEKQQTDFGHFNASDWCKATNMLVCSASSPWESRKAQLLILVGLQNPPPAPLVSELFI